jgi:hypothetical protein
MITLPTTPVAESSPTTVSTEVAAITLPTHNCRRPPALRAIHPSTPNPSPSSRKTRSSRFASDADQTGVDQLGVWEMLPADPLRQ